MKNIAFFSILLIFPLVVFGKNVHKNEKQEFMIEIPENWDYIENDTIMKIFNPNNNSEFIEITWESGSKHDNSSSHTQYESKKTKHRSKSKSVHYKETNINKEVADVYENEDKGIIKAEIELIKSNKHIFLRCNQKNLNQNNFNDVKNMIDSFSLIDSSLKGEVIENEKE